MDDFRQFQRLDCIGYSPNKSGCYGCPCCRSISFLRHFKKVSRKNARGRFRQQTKKLIQEQEGESHE